MNRPKPYRVNAGKKYSGDGNNTDRRESPATFYIRKATTDFTTRLVRSGDSKKKLLMPRRTKNNLVLGAAAVADLLSISKQKAADLMQAGSIVCRQYQNELVTTECNVRKYIENLFSNPLQQDSVFSAPQVLAQAEPDITTMHSTILHGIKSMQTKQKKRTVSLYNN